MELSQILPVYDRVVVKKIEQPDKTQGGIYFPETSKSPSQVGEVIAVGPGRNIDAPGAYCLTVEPAEARALAGATVEVLRPKMQCKVGDFVLFGKYAGADVKLGEQEVFLLREDEILAVLKDYKPEERITASSEQEAADPDELGPSGRLILAVE